ncbi:hypothetical protein [Aliarcobacter butzleri]|uniref:hypothetical protein n=1 Tax=Aliarcobacter butzleri TaxID=28197 RepID=UPI00344DB853
MKKFSKLFVSTKNTDKKLYFKIDYNITTIEKPNSEISISMELIITYLYLEKKDFLNKIETTTNTWKFSSTYNKKCSLCNSVRINNLYRSYGIGTFVLNEIIKIANEYIPGFYLQGSLGPADEENENKERRNSLYKNIGFKLEPNYFYIEKISDLNFNREFNYIQELKILDIFNTLCEFQNKNKQLENKLKIKIEKSDFLVSKNKKYTQIVMLLFYPLLLLSIFNIWYFFIR